jgi:hypothetical protein
MKFMPLLSPSAPFFVRKCSDHHAPFFCSSQLLFETATALYQRNSIGVWKDIRVDELGNRFISHYYLFCGFPMPINIKGKIENANLFSS